MVQWKIQEIKVYEDSQLIINQINDNYQTKDNKLTPYKKMVESLKDLFINITFEKIPHMNNRVAYVMETIRSLLDMLNNILKCEFLVEQLLIPTFKILESEFVCVIVGPRSLWYHSIFTYLNRRTLPSDITPNLKKTFVKKESRFVVLGDTLYHQSIEGTLL